MIEVEHLTKLYDRTRAIDDVTFSVGEGEVLGFLGPNGAGKTTTMRAITGYIPPTDGRIRVGGFDVAEQPLEVRRRIGYLPENPPLYPEMTVRGYLRFIAEVKGVERAGVETEVGRVMDRVHVEEVGGRIIGRLSKGYKQRVGLAQALIGDPPVLILDEPTVGLDPRQIQEVRELIRDLSGGHTVILSTHILPEVEQTCSRVVIISRGRIVAVDSPRNLVAQLKGGDWTRIEVRGPREDILGRIRVLPGVTDVRVGKEPAEGAGSSVCGLEVESRGEADPRPQLARAVVEGGWDLLGMQSMTMSLEDIFLELTTSDEEPGAGMKEPE
jgi:ABC-2 type transport system ATP-binding protein